ncbi:MAG: hypothetical protein AB7H80_03205 [Candidatus Kapaibacterium sp.]
MDNSEISVDKVKVQIAIVDQRIAQYRKEATQILSKLKLQREGIRKKKNQYQEKINNAHNSITKRQLRKKRDQDIARRTTAKSSIEKKYAHKKEQIAKQVEKKSELKLFLAQLKAQSSTKRA